MIIDIPRGIAVFFFAICCWSLATQASGEDSSLQLHVRYTKASSLAPEDADKLILEDKGLLPSADQTGNRVIMGEDVDLRNFADVVKIGFRDTLGHHTCSGVLLSKDAVLTAGHCGCGRDYEVSVQTAPVRPGLNQAFQTLPVAAGPIVFPGYDCSDPDRTGVGRDLALLRLAKVEALPDGIAIGEVRVRIQYAVIRSTMQVLSDRGLKSLYIVGFGTTETGDLARNLQGANVGLLSRNCAAGHVFLSSCGSFREFAMGRSRFSPGLPADSCGGDSGGPAYRVDSDAVLDRDGARIGRLSDRTLVGIVSRALAGVVHPYKGYCGGGGIYTAVGTRPVLNWLREQKVNFSYDANPTYIPKKG